MAEDITISNLLAELFNIVCALFFLAAFIFRFFQLRRLSQSSKFEHLYPYGRAVFVIVYTLVSIVQLSVMLGLRQYHSTIELYFNLGAFINSVVLIVQLFLLRTEIKKQRPYTVYHRAYWLYLPIITTTRLVLEIYYIDTAQIDVTQVVLTAVQLADALFLALYSIFFKRQDIKEFENYSLFYRDKITDALLSPQSLITNKTSDADAAGDFPSLKVEFSYAEGDVLIFKVYSAQGLLSKRVASMRQFSDFVDETSKFDLECGHPFVSKQKRDQLEFDVGRMSMYLNELLSQQKYYEPFVLRFFNVPLQKIEKFNQAPSFMANSVESQMIDTNSIYINIVITGVKRLGQHYYYNIIASIPNVSRSLQKRYSDFEELDRKLKLLLVGEVNYRPPHFPEKHLHHDEQILEDRRIRLEEYLRKVCNDFQLLIHARTLLYEFLAFPEDLPLPEKRPYITGLTCDADSMVKAISSGHEAATYYIFIVKRGPYQELRKIQKRYMEFDQLNKQVKRFLHNSRLENCAEARRLLLPPKKINISQKDKCQRHQQLAQYLNTLFTIPRIDQLYEYRAFLNVNIDSSRKISVEMGRPVEIQKSSVESDSNRMSLLIDNLGSRNN